MRLIVNGEHRECEAATVAALLRELEFEGDFFAVAVNREVVQRRRWDEAVLRDGDEVEVLTPRQGG